MEWVGNESPFISLKGFTRDKGLALFSVVPKVGDQWDKPLLDARKNVQIQGADLFNRQCWALRKGKR